MRKGSTFTLYAAAVLLCAAGVALSVVGDAMDGRLPGYPGASGMQAQQQAPKEIGVSLGQPAVVVNGSTVVSKGMTVYWVARYALCGHEVVRMEQPESRFVGKTVSEFAASYPDYTLEITNGQVKMIRSFNQYCPNHYYIKSDDSGNIYVYRNLDGLDKLTMVMKLSFTMDFVPADFKPLIKEGMAFGSIEEIEGLIEDAET